MSVKITHPDKIYWPKEKITKAEFIQYYTKVSKTLLKYTKARPLVMKRFPNGIKKGSFFQKNVETVPVFVKTATISHANRKVKYILCENLKTLQYTANLGSIELHLMHTRASQLQKPDYLLLDLDPLGISFDSVVDVALVIHKILDQLKIPNYCKTSGGTGLHILIPLKGKYSFDLVRKAAKEIAKRAHEELPKITSLERSPAKRKRKVYIDTLQNNKGQLMIAPYSVRAKEGAPVSTPLSWSEVKHGLDPNKFNIKTTPKRLSLKGDLLSGIFSKSANLKKVLSKK